jgi:hypothetical protein
MNIRANIFSITNDVSPPSPKIITFVLLMQINFSRVNLKKRTIASGHFVVK